MLGLVLALVIGFAAVLAGLAYSLSGGSEDVSLAAIAEK